MRSADNRVTSVLAQYREQLGALYPEGELRAITRTVFQEMLGWDVAQLEIRKFESLSESELLKVYLPLQRLRAGEPIQHVLGEVRFHGMRLTVTPDVLIPRPETEELVELIIANNFTPRGIVDIGTGSGCIALALKKAFPNAVVHGMDLSDEALRIAGANAQRNSLDVEWIMADILEDGYVMPVGTDMIVSNPPYIPRSEEHDLAQQVRAHEPHMALFTPDDDPLLFYRAIGNTAFLALPVGGQLWFEGHWKHASAAGDLLRIMGYASVEVLADLSGHERFIHAVR